MNAAASPTNAEPVIIKKYANRRLYNTETSSYITLDDLAKLVQAGRVVEVVDAKSGADLTRATLAQIILDEDGQGAALLPVGFLRHLIGFYGHGLQTVVPHYLTMVMDVFQQNQQRLKDETNRTLGGFSPFAQLAAMQDLQRAQMARMQEMLAVFNPFLSQAMAKAHEQSQAAIATAQSPEIAALKAEIATLKAALAMAQRAH